MHNDLKSNNPSGVSAPQDKTQDVIYVQGVVTGCFGCFGAFVLSIIGFIAGYSFVGVAHEREWFYTQEEFKNRHGLSDTSLVAFGNLLTGGFVGAFVLPILVGAIFVLLRSHKKLAK